MFWKCRHLRFWHVWDMPTDAGNVCFLGYFGSPVSGSSGPVLTRTGHCPVKARIPLLLASHHRLSGDKRLDARIAKSRLAHPIGALRPAVAEPCVGPKQHIQA